MWSPAVTAVKAQGIKCVYQPLKEGYRGWGNGLALMAHLDGLKRDAAYEYLNWYNSGWVGGFIAKQGYYSANPKTAMANLTENERGFFYEGKAATADITSPTGEKTNSAGDVRDGGSYEERFSKVGGVEQPDGRGRVPLRQVERVQRGIDLPADLPAGAAPCRPASLCPAGVDRHDRHDGAQKSASLSPISRWRR